MGDVYDILDNDMKHRLTFLKTSPIIEQTWADPGICHKADYNLGNCSIIQLIAGKATEGQGWGWGIDRGADPWLTPRTRANIHA